MRVTYSPDLRLRACRRIQQLLCRPDHPSLTRILEQVSQELGPCTSTLHRWWGESRPRPQVPGQTELDL